MFYTYYKQWGNSIFYSYIDEHGTQHHTKITDYEPTLYLKSSEPTEFKSIYGHYVSPVKHSSIKDAKDFIEKYKHVDGMSIEGNTKFANQFVIELFEGQMPEYNPSLIKGCILDIEVTAPEFPKPIEAKYAIDLMTLYNTNDKVFKVFSLYDYDQSIDETDAGSLKIDFKKYNNERDLLLDFVSYMQQQKFNWISGWNSSGFDLPYIANRILGVLGKSVLNKLSPYGIVNIREITDDYNNSTITADVIGLTDLDYMLMYQKHIYEPRENYRLDFICEVELGKRKLSYEEEGSLFNLSKTNPQKYVSYNLIDVLRLVELEDKLGLFPVMYVLAYYSMSNFDAGLATVDPWENFIAKELYIRGMVPPKKESRAFRPFVGAYVAEPQVGYHQWGISLDLNSLYPHIMMQVNISPETYIPRYQVSDELANLQDELSVKERTTYFIQCRNLVDKQVDLSILKKHDVSMAANGQYYTRKHKGIIPIIVEEIYNNRKKFKKLMNKAKQELVDAKSENANKSILDKISSEVSKYNNLQMAMKIFMNSLYGAMGNRHFLYFMIENAEAITTTGQVVNLWTTKRINKLLNEVLENNKQKDYILAGDTDSGYFILNDIVSKSDMQNKTDDEIADFIDTFVKEIIDPEVTSYTNELCDYLNNIENKMVWEREAIFKSSINSAKKHYAMLVIDSEGVRYKTPELKIVGLESKKSSTPAWAKPMLENCYRLCLEQKEDEFYKYVEKARKTVYSLDPSQIAIPTTINGIEKYLNVFDYTYTKGAPKHVKAAIVHNRLLKQHNIKHIDDIKSGGSMKYVELKQPNKIGEEAIGFEKYLPKEFNLDAYVNYEDAYKKGFEKPLKNFIKAIGWEPEPVIGLF